MRLHGVKTLRERKREKGELKGRWEVFIRPPGPALIYSEVVQ